MEYLIPSTISAPVCDLCCDDDNDDVSEVASDVEVDADVDWFFETLGGFDDVDFGTIMLFNDDND